MEEETSTLATQKQQSREETQQVTQETHIAENKKMPSNARIKTKPGYLSRPTLLDYLCFAYINHLHD